MSKVGETLRYILYHTKSVEVKLINAQAIHQFTFKDKKMIGDALRKIKSATEDIISVIKDPDLVKLVREDLDRPDLVYYLMLTEQLFTLNEETLEEITELIDNHLNKKFNDTVGQDNTAGNDQRKYYY